MLAKPSRVGRESVGEARPSRIDTFSASNGDDGLVISDLSLIGVNRGSMTIKRMDELMSRYGMPPSYICRVPTISEYVSILGLLEIGMCEETFSVKFWIPVH